MTAFLDTNILIYLLDENAQHHKWSVEQLDAHKAAGPALVSDIVYCEVAVGMNSQEEVDAAIAKLALERVSSDETVLFRAAMAFKDYKKNGGPKPRILPDFLVGAIAEINGVPLLTANSGDFKNYFPKLKLIQPE